jgi:hypothetical protein
MNTPKVIHIVQTLYRPKGALIQRTWMDVIERILVRELSSDGTILAEAVVREDVVGRLDEETVDITRLYAPDWGEEELVEEVVEEEEFR